VDSGLLLALDHTLIFVFHHCPAHVVIQFLFLEMEVLLGLGELATERVNHDLLLLQNCQERSFLAQGSLHLECLALALELDLAEVILKALFLEFELVILGLDHTSLVPLLLNVFGILDQEFILVDLELISLLSKVKTLLLRFTEPSLKVVNIAPQLPLLLPVFAWIFDSQLKGVVIGHELLKLRLVPPFKVRDNLVILNFLSFNLCLWELVKSLGLKIVFTDLL
jgi:hypothetical protein